MPLEDYKRLLAELADARKLKNNWYLVATAVERVKKTDDGPQQWARRLKDASDASGFSANTINRMLTVREFFDSVKVRVTELEGIDANVLSFPSLEVVKRLHQVDEKEGTKMLVEVATGRITFRELRERYNRVVSENTYAASAYQTARLEVRDFESAAMQAMCHATGDLFGSVRNVKIERPGAFNLPVDAVAYDRSPYPIAGFEFVFLRDPENPKQILETMLYRILFCSTFFRSFWVVFASNTGEKRIHDFSEILDKLNYPSIGVAVLPWGEENQSSTIARELQIIREPVGRPIPDHCVKVGIVGSLRDLLIRPMTASSR